MLNPLLQNLGMVHPDAGAGKNCWSLTYDGFNWLLNGGNGMVVYAMTDAFNCKGANVFDIILENNCADPIPPSITIYPMESGCDCAPPT